MRKILMGLIALSFASEAFAEGQVFYRYGKNKLNEARSGQIFTDIAGANAARKNDDDSSTTIGAGLNLGLMNCPLFPENMVLGEIYVDYSKFSDKEVPNAIKAVASHTTTGTTTITNDKITVSELAVVIAPKYRFGGMDKFRPWIVPIGLAFMVNNPPSNTTSYLDVGYHMGAGAEYMIHEKLSLGADVRHTSGSGDPGLKMKYTSYAGYLGINF